MGITTTYSHRFVMELLQWHKVYSLGENETPRGGLNLTYYGFVPNLLVNKEPNGITVAISELRNCQAWSVTTQVHYTSVSRVKTLLFTRQSHMFYLLRRYIVNSTFENLSLGQHSKLNSWKVKIAKLLSKQLEFHECNDFSRHILSVVLEVKSKKPGTGPDVPLSRKWQLPTLLQRWF